MRASLDEIWADIRQRRGWRVLSGYLATGLATTLAVAELYEVIGLPESTPRVVMAVFAGGLPVVLGVTLLRSRARTTPGARVVAAEREAAPTAASGRLSSILVTPFQNRSPDPDNEYVADGITEEIITDLSTIRSLRVISRSSAMRLKQSEASFVHAGRELDVDYVLEGSVRRSGDELRVTARLVEVRTEEAVWSERYDGNFDEIFAIETRVAHSVAERLRVYTGSGDLAVSGASALPDARAYESYLRARYETLHFSRSGIENAVRHLEAGLAAVGENPLLLASLGHAYTWYTTVGLDPDGAHLAAARDCVQRIFAIEPDSARGHWLQGLVRFQAGELRAAKAPLERAVERMPNDPDVLLMLGYLSSLRGQHDHARAAFERCLSVDPLTPINHAMAGFVSIMEGKPADAVSGYAKYLEMDPESPFANWCYVWVILWCGRLEEARERTDRLQREHADSLFTQLAVATTRGLEGDRAAALSALSPALRAAGRRNELFSRELAHCLALAGENHEALDWLENTIRIGNVNFPFWSEHDRWLDNLRDEPRFETLMRQVEREWQALNPDLVT